MQASVPLATYRFQLHKGFPLREATKLLPYLRNFGVSHVYCSPLLQASPGSTHGYDCADHKHLNREIASEEEFEAFAAKLKELEMSVLLDIVPNHAALHPTNPTLMDVLESGRSSAFAHFYDINWGANRFGLAGRLLLPVLGTHLSNVLEKGEVKLVWHETMRSFAFTYYSWVMPADPVTVARFLLRPSSLPLPSALLDPLRHLAAIPTHGEGGATKRQTLLPQLKQRLADSVSGVASVRSVLVERLALNVQDMLTLLNEQPYRLAYWRTAASEINYRRFFDINELIALRMEEKDVFDYTHALPLEWLKRGIVSGLRVDHPDGLANPQQYFDRLQRLRCGKGIYVLAEKILSSGEEWQRDWATHGTTGYEFMNVLTGVFVDARAEDDFTQRWQALTGITMSWPEMARHCKRLVLKRSFESDLNRSAEALYALFACGPHRDWTISHVRRALLEFIAALPVYRTYVTADGDASLTDATFIHEAVEIASHRKGVEQDLLHALAEVFLIAPIPTQHAHPHPNMVDRAELRRRFVTQLQQLTGVVMAKGCEDTAFYRYLRLTALNEVGGDPGQFGTSLEAFHKFNVHRAMHWPAALSSVSTHDTKRGSDARLRLAVLSEMSGEWFAKVSEWMAINADLKPDGFPQANEEQFLYQTIVAAWETGATTASATFVDRIEAYIMKASKEAKVFTSWTEANELFESAFKSFIRRCLASERFLASLVPFAATVHRLARLSCISHTILHTALPGVPDVYQGTELWDLSLVDPDNRRPPNWDDRQAKLQRKQQQQQQASLLKMVESDTDGWSKMWTLSTMLALRSRLRDVFEHGTYTPATLTGPASERIVAFERKRGDKEVVVAVGRFFARSKGGEAWANTTLKVLPGSEWTDCLSGAKFAATESGSLTVSELFASGPWVVLENLRNNNSNNNHNNVVSTR